MRQRFAVRVVCLNASCAPPPNLRASAALRWCWPPASCCPGSSRSRTPLQLPRSPAHVRLPQLQHLLLDFLRRLVAMPVRARFCSISPSSPRLRYRRQPHVPGLARDPVARAQLASCVRSRISCSKINLSFSSITLLVFHGMRSVLHAICHHFPAVSGIRPVYSVRDVPGLYHTPPRPFFQLLLQTKPLCQSTLGWPLRHAWVALGPPLGHPRATQSQTQSQTQSAEGRKPKEVARRFG